MAWSLEDNHDVHIDVENLDFDQCSGIPGPMEKPHIQG